MSEGRHPIVILIADDDVDDRMLMRKALLSNHISNEVREVSNGQQLLDYLYRRGAYESPADLPRPDLIFLDLHMPRVDGRKALEEIRADPRFRHIPVVVLTTSVAEEDMIRSYELGANAFISKSFSFGELVHALESVHKFWFELVRRPPPLPSACPTRRARPG